MSKSTILAEGWITRSDRLVIELSESIEAPAAVLLIWPPQASVTDPLRFPATANAIMAIMGAAAAKLAVIRADEL
jgi:hypothetical protein